MSATRSGAAAAFDPHATGPRARRFVADSGTTGPRLFRQEPSEASRVDADPCQEPLAESEPAAAPAPDPDEIARRAYAEGLEAGRGELPWREAEALRTAVAAVESAARSLADLRRGYLLENRRALVELAVVIAERILARRLETDPDALAALVERAAGAVGEEAPVRVLLSPADFDTCQAGIEDRLRHLADRGELRVEAHSGLERGEARVAAGASEVDARLPAILERVRDELAEVLRTPETEGS